MMRSLLLLIALLYSVPTMAQPNWLKVVVKIGEHVTFGAALETGGAYAAGGRNNWQAGIVTAAVGAGIKEFYGDWRLGKGEYPEDHPDTFWQATGHFFTAMAGAAAMAAGNHDYSHNKPIDIDDCYACRPLPEFRVKH